MTFDDFIDGFTNDELLELAGAVRRNEVSAALEADLRSALEDVPMADRQEAFEEKAGIVDVLQALGLEFEFPDGELTRPEPDDVEGAEDGIEIEEAEPERPPDRPREGPGVDLPGTRRPTEPEPGVQPGEEIIRDESRLSGEDIRRDLGFERVFMDLIRDVGRCRQFKCFSPELYFRLTPSEQRRFFDMTPEEVLAWLVRRREATPEQLAARGFPSDVIP